MRKLWIVMFLLLMNLALCAAKSDDIKPRYYFTGLTVDSNHSAVLIVRNLTPTMFELKVQFVGARWTMKNYMGSGRTALVSDPGWILYIKPSDENKGEQGIPISKIVLAYTPKWTGILTLRAATGDFQASIAICPAGQEKFDSNCRVVEPTVAYQGDKQGKIPTLTESIEKEKKRASDLQKHYDTGNTFYQSKQYDQALAEFQQAAEIDPSQSVVFAHIADVYSAMGNYDEAATNYQKATSILEAKADIKPNQKQSLADYYNNYGGVLAKAGKTKEALEAYKKAIDIFPAKAGMYYFNVGVVLTNSHAPLEDRVAAFKKATEADPKNANAWYRYGLMLSEKMRLKPDGKADATSGMVEAFQKYLEFAPNGPYAADANRLISAARGTPVKR